MIPAHVVVARNTKSAVAGNRRNKVMSNNYQERLDEIKERYHDLRDLL